MIHLETWNSSKLFLFFLVRIFVFTANKHNIDYGIGISSAPVCESTDVASAFRAKFAGEAVTLAERAAASGFNTSYGGRILEKEMATLLPSRLWRSSTPSLASNPQNPGLGSSSRSMSTGQRQHRSKSAETTSLLRFFRQGECFAVAYIGRKGWYQC